MPWSLGTRTNGTITIADLKKLPKGQYLYALKSLLLLDYSTPHGTPTKKLLFRLVLKDEDDGEVCTHLYTDDSSNY